MHPETASPKTRKLDRVHPMDNKPNRSLSLGSRGKSAESAQKVLRNRFSVNEAPNEAPAPLQKMLELLSEPQQMFQRHQRVFQEVKVTSMTRLKSNHGMAEDKQRRKVMREADISHIMHRPSTEQQEDNKFPKRVDRDNVARMLTQDVNAEAHQIRKQLREFDGKSLPTPAVDVVGGGQDQAVEADAKRRADDASLLDFTQTFGLDLRAATPRTQTILETLWGGQQPITERELGMIEAQFRMEFMLSVGAIVLETDKEFEATERAHDTKVSMLTTSINAVRARTKRRVELAKRLQLLHLKKEALYEVHGKRERARKLLLRNKSEALQTIADAFSGPRCGYTGGVCCSVFLNQ